LDTTRAYAYGNKLPNRNASYGACQAAHKTNAQPTASLEIPAAAGGDRLGELRDPHLVGDQVGDALLGLQPAGDAEDRAGLHVIGDAPTFVTLRWPTPALSPYSCAFHGPADDSCSPSRA